MIRFSFIVLFHNNNSTDLVIDSILNQSISGDEIIIVDDHSEPENLKMFDRFYGLVTILHTDCVGNRGYNRNYGAAYAHNNHLLFVDGDIVFLPNAIMSMRESMEKGNVGAVGNVICSSNTFVQMDLLTGLDYINLIKTDLSVEKLIQLNLFSDQRQQYIYDKMVLDSVWEYFYSAYCAVDRSVFEKIGGFETNFVGWGVEDDELGYRLHLEGKLDYNLSAYAVHIPHMRNLYQCLTSNRINLYRFLAKYPSNEIAMHMTFGNSIKTHLTIEYITSKLIEKNTYIFDFNNRENSIFINELTSDYPNGYVCFLDKERNTHILELYGIALPFKNKNFEIAFCTENIFVYPEIFFSAILNEMLRIANEVRIIKLQKTLRIRWSSEQISGLSYISSSGRIVYIPTKICDFNIDDCGDYYKITDGIASEMNENFIVSENFYHPEYFSTDLEHYILINLTNAPLSLAEKSHLMKKYSILIYNFYDVAITLGAEDIRLSHILYGDIYRIHTPIVYLIPKGCKIIKDDKWWHYPFRQNDLIIQRT